MGTREEVWWPDTNMSQNNFHPIIPMKSKLFFDEEPYERDKKDKKKRVKRLREKRRRKRR